MRIIRFKNFTRNNLLVPEISPRKFAIREYASLNSNPDTSIKLSKKQVNISCKLVLAKNTLFAIELVYALYVGSQVQCYRGMPV